MNIIILGPQASGKGTQAELLSKKLGAFHVESGGLLRKLAKRNPKIDAIINVRGELVPDRETLGYIAEELEKHNALEKGIIFDGYPRSLNQYKLLKDWLKTKGQQVNKTIFIDVGEDTTIKRLSARRVCEKCGTIYNLITNPPSKKDACECGGRLIQRKDDQPETIKKRLAVYRKQTEPLVGFLEKEGALMKVNGERPIKVIFEDIMARINE